MAQKFNVVKVIPLKLSYYQTFFETWRIQNYIPHTELLKSWLLGRRKVLS